ncbi:MAG: TraB/GumN family protein [Candidatus Bathyarchaeia archaeon]
MVEILDIDYNSLVELVGTAHFTQRSINDALEAVRSKRPKDVAIELDMKRYRQLSAYCARCPKAAFCKGLCEFTGAADALGNVDANIWLIDMTEEEMRRRIILWSNLYERPYMGVAMPNYGEDLARLWEMGYKEAVIEHSERQIEALRRINPAIPRVLIDERNVLMAARLAWIASKEPSQNSKILAFVGAAHVKGIKDLLANPSKIRDRFRAFNLSFSEPTLVRRVAVQAA